MEENLKSKLLDARMDEMAARERIIEGLRALNMGQRTTRKFCEIQMGYSPQETRALLASLGLIITSDAMTSQDPKVQTRIERLRDWRLARARRAGLPPYRVLSNRVLMSIASECPNSPESLQELKGFGPKSAKVYAAELLELLGS